MSLRALILGTTATALLAGAGVAQAEDRHGWYMGLELGWVKVLDTDHGNSGRTFIQFANDAAGLAEVGYAFNGRWRVELEGGYRRNEVDKIGLFGNPPVSATGDIRNYTLMVNAIWDAKLSNKWSLSLGAGIGGDRVRYADQAFGPPTTADTSTVFAAQGLAGLSYQLAAHWDLFAQYRYLWADQPNLTLSGVQCQRTTCSDDMSVRKHTVLVGFRYGFDEPPPPAPVVAPPPPPPAPPAHFIIFFGFNKCNITAEADSVLSEAASAAKSMGSASVTVVGHTDTVGSMKYNQRLSECRANAAASNLESKGVPKGAISTSGKGKTELMVQTGDGVKEPQNRRATVDLH